MNADHPAPADAAAVRQAGGARPDLSNVAVREDLARAGRCALVHLPTGRICLLLLRHHGPCEFHRPQDAADVVSAGG